MKALRILAVSVVVAASMFGFCYLFISIARFNIVLAIFGLMLAWAVAVINIVYKFGELPELVERLIEGDKK